MKLSEFKKKYPAYKDVPDQDLAGALYKKYYDGKLSPAAFKETIGIPAESISAEPEPGAWDRVKQAGSDLWDNITGKPDPGVGPVSKEDFQAFSPDSPLTIDMPDLSGIAPERPKYPHELETPEAREERLQQQRAERDQRMQATEKAMQDMGATTRQIGKVYPVLEALGYWTTQPIAAAASGIAGLGMTATGKDDEDVLDTMEAIQGLVGYEPMTDEGKRFTKTSEYPFEKLEELAGRAGEHTLEKTESPEWATLVHTLIAGAPVLAMGIRPGRAGARKAAEGVKKGWDSFLKSEPGRAYQKMSTEKRVRAAERAGKDMGALLRENPDLTEAQIARISRQHLNKYYDEMRQVRGAGERPATPAVDPIQETTAQVPARPGQVSPAQTRAKTPPQITTRPTELPAGAQRQVGAPETIAPKFEQITRQQAPEMPAVAPGVPAKTEAQKPGPRLPAPKQPAPSEREAETADYAFTDAMVAKGPEIRKRALEQSEKGRLYKEIKKAIRTEKEKVKNRPANTPQKTKAKNKRYAQLQGMERIVDLRLQKDAPLISPDPRNNPAKDIERRFKDRAKKAPEDYREAYRKADDEVRAEVRRDLEQEPPAAGQPEIVGQVKKAVDTMVDTAIKASPSKKGVKFADLDEIYGFINTVQKDVRRELPDRVDEINNAFENIGDYAIQKIRKEYNLQPKERLVYESTSIQPSKGISKAKRDWEKIVQESFHPQAAETIGYTKEGEEIMRVVGGKHHGQTMPISEIDKKGIPRPESGVEKRAKEKASLDFLDEDVVDSLTIKEVNAENADTVRAAVKKSLKQGKPVPAEILAEYPDLTPAGQPETVTDPARRQQLKNAIAEGEAILNSGKNTVGRKMSAEELRAVQQSVDNARKKIGETASPKKEPVSARQPGEPAEMPDRFWPQDRVEYSTPGGRSVEADIIERADNGDYKVRPVEANNTQFIKPEQITKLIKGDRPRQQAKKYYENIEKNQKKPEAPEPETLSPKEQRQLFLKQIDKSIEQAPEFQQVQGETVSIQIPGDGEFHLLNSQAALKEVRKKVAKSWPTSVPPKKDAPKKTSSRSVKNRVSSEDSGTVEYYNEFKPRTRKKIVTGGNSLVWKDGYFSDGRYIIQLPEKPKLTANQEKQLQGAEAPYNLQEILNTRAKPAQIMGEAASPEAPDPMAHVRSEYGDFLYRAEFLDNILTFHPKAKPTMAENGLLIFKSGDQKVAALMPFDMPKKAFPTEYQASRFNEIHGAEFAPGQPGTAAPQPGAGTAASDASYAKDADFQSRHTGPDTSDYTGKYGDGGDLPAAMDMPEIVEVARQLLDGKLPKVMRKMRARNAAGLFRHGGQQGHIELLSAIFESPEIARKVLAHEIGHLVDWLPDKTLSRGNLLGRVATLKRNMQGKIALDPQKPPKELSPQRKQELLEEARKLAKAEANQLIDEEITRTLPVKPDDVIAIWNHLDPEKFVGKDLIDYVKSLDAAAKKSIIKQALKGQTPAELSAFSKSVVEKTGKQTKVGGYHEKLKRFYRDLVKKEIQNRKYVYDKQIRDELKNFTQKWKPFNPAADPKYTKYRFSGPELYADAISGLITNPAALKTEAPTFYKAFFNYLDRKPEVAKIYEQIQTDISQGAEMLAEQRAERLKSGFKQGMDLRAERQKAMMKRPQPNRLENILTWFDDKNSPLYQRLIRKYEREKDANGNLTRRAKQAIELRARVGELENFPTMAQAYVLDVRKDVLTPLRENEISLFDLDYYLFQKRVIGERFNIANPLGHYKELSQKDLATMMRKWGPKKTQTIQKLAWDFRDLRENEVFPILEKGGLYKPDLIEKIKNTTDYATFSVNKYINDQFGTGIGAKIYPQYGTLQEVSSLVEATLIKDMQMMRASLTNEMKQKFEAMAQQVGADMLEPAEMYYSRDYKRQMPKEPKDPDKDIFTVFHDGKPVHYYASRAIADVFAYDPVRASGFERAMTLLGRPVRELYVSKNPEWMVRNIVRDFMETAKKLPEVEIRSMPRLAKLYKQAYKEVIPYVYKGQLSPDMREMARRGMFPRGRMWSGTDPSITGEIENIIRDSLAEFADESAKKYPTAVRAVQRVWNEADNAASVSEIAGKVAAYKFLIEQAPDRPLSEVGIRVRDYAATPNIRQRGRLSYITNNLFPFSNVGKASLKASYATLRDAPGPYIWKTTLFNFIPLAIRHGFKAGTILYLMEHILNEEDQQKDRGMMGMIDQGVQRAKAISTDRKLEKLDQRQRSYLRDFLSQAIGPVKHMTRMYQGISEYDMDNYHVIPMYLRKDGKTVYLRIPMDYEGMYLSRLAADVMKGQFTGSKGLIKDLAEWGPYGVGNLNELIKQPYVWLQYFGMGRTPVDDWTGNQILTRQEKEAGGMYAAGKLAKHSWSQIGGRLLYEPAWSRLDTERGAWEGFLNTQPGKILGSWVKISDRGIIEQVYDRLGEIRKRKAKEALDRKDAYIKLANGELLTVNETLNILTDSSGRQQEKIIDLLVQKSGGAYARALRKVNTREEKAAVLELMLEHNYRAKPIDNSGAPSKE